MTRALKIAIRTACLLAMAAAAACGGADEAIDIQVFPARHDPDPGQPPPEGWSRVEFAGSTRSRAGTFLVSEVSLLSGWNIVAFRPAAEPDGSRAIGLRLNAAGQQKMKDFTAEEANLRTPLAVRVDERWVDFSPLLRDPGDRMMLYGFTAEEAQRLERWLTVR